MFKGKEYVYEVYQKKSFSKASKALYISQPALSNSIRRVEEKVGAPLFDRSTSPVQLTEIGTHYIRAVEKIMEAQKEFESYLFNCHELKSGDVTIGTDALLASYVLPKLISSFKDRYPGVRINIVENSASFLCSRLEEGILDLLLAHQEIDNAQFDAIPFKKEHLILAVPASFSVNQNLKRWQMREENITNGNYLKSPFPAVPLEKMAELPFILPPRESSERKVILNLCRMAGFCPREILSLEQQLTSYHVSGEGIGISFISDALVRYAPGRSRLIYYKIAPSLAERQLSFYLKKNRYMTRATEAFLKMSCPDARLF